MQSSIVKAHFIVYVADQERSATFYTKVLDMTPTLHVPGMTEFAMPGGSVLGLMPERGIKKLLGPALPLPPDGMRAARAELYLIVNSALEYHQRALNHGARELSAPELRAWGDTVAYSLDLDGHVLAFAHNDS